MNTNSGIEISTSLLITEYARCTIRSSVWPIARSGLRIRYAKYANSIPMPISVNAVGKPSMIATTTSASISSPRWPLCRFPQGISTITAATISPMIASPK